MCFACARITILQINSVKYKTHHPSILTESKQILSLWFKKKKKKSQPIKRNTCFDFNSRWFRQVCPPSPSNVHDIAAIYPTILSLLKARYKVACSQHNNLTGEFISFFLQIRRTEAQTLRTQMGTAGSLQGPPSPAPLTPWSTRTVCLESNSIFLYISFLPPIYSYSLSEINETSLKPFLWLE